MIKYLVGDFDEKGPIVGVEEEDGTLVKFVIQPGMQFIRSTIDFAWGLRHGNRALTQLAFAILLYATLGDKEFAFKHAPEFKAHFLATIPGDVSWKIPFDLVNEFIRSKIFGRMPM